MLSEQNRTKLDGIVSQMTANGESEDTIKFVVEDFKQKYQGAVLPTDQKPALEASTFLDDLVKPQEAPTPKPIDWNSVADTTVKVVKATPQVIENVKDTFTTKQGLSDLWNVTKNAGVESVKNVMTNYNELFWSGAQKGFKSVGLDTFSDWAGKDVKIASSDAKKSSEEIQKFFYGNGLDVIGYSDPNDTRSFAEKISSPDGEKEVAKVLGSQVPTFLSLLGITVLAKGANLPALPATLATSFAMNTGDAYQQGKSYVESTGEPMTPEMENKIQKSAVLAGIMTAPLDAYGIDRILKPSQFLNFKNKFVKEAINGILDMGADTVVEGGTEALQEIIQNAWARTYNENQNLFEGALESAFGGGIFGGGSSAIINSAGLLRTGVLERLKAGKTPEEIKDEVKTGAKTAGTTISDQKIDEAVADAQNVYTGIVEDITSKLDMGKSVNEVALEISQNAPVDKAVEFVQKVAETQAPTKAVTELNAISNKVDESVLTKTAQDMQNDFEQVQTHIDEQVKELTQKVADLKEKVDNALNNSVEKKQLKAQLQNAKNELEQAKTPFFEKVAENAKAFTSFITDYVSKLGYTTEKASEVATKVSEVITDPANISSGKTIQEYITENLPQAEKEEGSNASKKEDKKAVKKQAKKTVSKKPAVDEAVKEDEKAPVDSTIDKKEDTGDTKGNETDTNTKSDTDGGEVSTPVQESANEQGGTGTGTSNTRQSPRRTKRPIVDSKTTRERLGTRLTNEEVEKAISEVATISTDGKVELTGEITPEILEIANQYKTGGVTKEGRGILDEYYTNEKIVDIVKSILELPSTPIKVLEPSVGTGNFLYALPDISTQNITAFEINPTSAKIAKIFHNNATIFNKGFETLFMDERGNKKTVTDKYDLVIGNPPYGEHRGEFLGLGEESDFKKYEEYFVKRGLDLLTKDGKLVMVIPSSFLRSGENKAKINIGINGLLVDAYRLPNGVFEGTDIGTDIVIFKKRDQSTELTDVSSMVDDEFFKKHPEKILGTVKKVKNRFGKMEDHVVGDIESATADFYNNHNKSEAVKLLVENNIEQTPENVESAESAVDESGEKAKAVVKEEEIGKKTIEKKIVTKTSKKDKTMSLSTLFTEYTPEELELWKNIEPDGSVFKEDIVAKYRDVLNFVAGKYYNDFYYQQGDIYEKLTQLQSDFNFKKIGKEQYNKQKAKLEAVLPKKQAIDEAKISPNLEFVKNLKLDDETTLRDEFITFIRTLPYEAFGGSSKYEVEEYTKNRSVTGSDKEFNDKVRTRRKIASDNLFAKFIKEGLTPEQKTFVEDTYNRTFNFHHEPDYTKVPLFSDVHATYQGHPFNLRGVQRAGIGRLVANGVGLLAHDVGFGKTISGVIAIAENLHRGWTKKPIIVVPNENVYQQWVNTIQELIPNAKLNLLGNLGVSYKGDLSSLKVEDGSITLLTYEGFKRLSFNDDTYAELSSKFKYISDDLKAHKTEREKQKDAENVKEIAGRGKKGTRADLFFEDLGFDHLTFDEVHNANHIVSKVKLEKGQASEYNRFALRSSDLGIKTWLASQYIQNKMDGRNVNLLSATPFTNHPLEYYSVFSLIADKMLQKMGFGNVNEFFGTFMEAENDYEFKADGSYQRKTDIRSFKNYRQFKKLREAFIDFKDGEQSGIVRPARVQQNYEIPQSEYGLEIEAKAQAIFKENENEQGKGAKVLRAITELRKIAFSPFASKFSEDIGKDYKRFVNESPKIKVLMELIAQNKKDKVEAGQIVYVDQVGVEFLPLMREYMVKELGFKEKEVEIISGATAKPKRVDIQDRFNKGEVKVVIGSEAIKEGLNLQANTSDLYILSLPWNFTQLRQVIGRGWRQGNKWQNIRINNLFIQDSIDVFLSQKLENKQKRFEASVQSDANEIDVGDISFDEMKFDLIRDPVTRAKVEIEAEKERLSLKISQEKAEVAFASRRIESVNEAQQDIIDAQEGLKFENEQIAKRKAEGETDISTFWVEHYTEKIEKAQKHLKEEIEKIQAKGVNVDILLKNKEEGTKRVAELEAERDALEKTYDERVAKLTAELPPRVPYHKGIAEAFVTERAEQNKTFYQLRGAETKETIVPTVEVKEIKNASKTKVVKTKKKTVAKRTTGDPVLDVILDKEKTVEEKIDSLLSKKQENKEFKDVGKRVVGSKKETAVIKAIQRYGDQALIDALYELFGTDAIASLYKKDDILADTVVPTLEADEKNNVPSYVAHAKQKVLATINHMPNFKKAGGRYGTKPFWLHLSGDSSWRADQEPTILKMYPKLMQEYVTQLTQAKTAKELRDLNIFYVKPDGTFISTNESDAEGGDYIEIRSHLFGNVEKAIELAFTKERSVEHLENMKDLLLTGAKKSEYSDKYQGIVEKSWRNSGYDIDYFETEKLANQTIKENKEKAIPAIEEEIKKLTQDYTPIEKKKATKVETDLKHGNFKPLERVETTRQIDDKRVSAETLQKDFGVNSVQFGNYMDDATAKEHIRHTIASLEDIAQLLKLDIKKIISDKGLSLAFGARGGGGYNAHYEPTRNIINLTKGRGDGSFFHEFVHFMDLQLGGRYRKKWSSGKTRYYSSDLVDKRSLQLMQALTGDRIKMPKTFEPQDNPHFYQGSQAKEWYSEGMKFEDAVKKVEGMYSVWDAQHTAQNIADLWRKPVTVTVELYNEQHNYAKGSKDYGGEYWSRPEEMLARAGQAYIEDKMIEAGIKNNYLTRSTIAETDEKDGIAMVYPQGIERRIFNKHFDDLFDALREQYAGTKLKVEKGNFSTVPYTKSDAVRYLDDLKTRLNIDFDVNFVDTIISDYAVDPLKKARTISQLAFGAYRDNSIAIVNNAVAYTAEHESVHLTINNLDKIEAFKRAGITRNQLMHAMADRMGVVWTEKNDLDIEEQIAYDFEKYVNGTPLSDKKAPQGVLAKFFAILKRLAEQFGLAIAKTNGDLIKNYYDILAEGQSVEGELVRLDNKGIMEAFIEDGVLDVYEMDRDGASKFKMRVEQITTKLLQSLAGRDTVSKQYILDATNRPELKQVEKDLFRGLLETEGDVVNMESFAERVRAELLPLTVRNEDLSKKQIKKELKKLGLSFEQDMSGEANLVDNDGELVDFDTLPEETQNLVSEYLGNAETYRDIGGQKYESVTLPAELRGNVKNYKENVYESPIKTNAGYVHFPQSTHYFGHTRVEDMADNKTRRVIEVQSDLYQKENLERELEKNWSSLEEAKRHYHYLGKSDEEATRLAQIAFDYQGGSVKKLEQYNNPTAHFRMIREEIKKASEDGKVRLQFPTGETAMKIEGLGGSITFRGGHQGNTHPIKEADLYVGSPVNGAGRDWIITDVLGDWKFIAVPKFQVDKLVDLDNLSVKQAIKELDNQGGHFEQFDISGKVDTNNPIYRFYEKEVGRYLKNNYEAKTVTDKHGVSWYEVEVKPEHRADVTAFKIVEKEDAHMQKYKKQFNELVDKKNKLVADTEAWKTDIQEKLAKREETAQVIDTTSEDIKELSRFVTRTTPPVGTLTERGAEVADSLGFENEQEAQQVISDYLKTKTELVETQKQLGILRRKIQQAKLNTKDTNDTLRDIERRLKLRKRLLEQKDFYVKMGVARGAKVQMKMIRLRGVAIRNLQDTIGISDERVKKLIGNKRIHLMSEKEFNDFMSEFAGKAMDLRATLDARDEVRSIIQTEQLNKVDNLIKALKLPSIDKMTQAEAQEFASILYQYQFGDTFLTTRELETTVRTKFGEIRTERELLNKIEETVGIPRDALRGIEAKGSDIYRNWLQLANKNIFYKWLVGRKMLAKTKELNQVYKFRTRLNELVRNARKSRGSGSLKETIWDTLAPTDTEVFNALDTGDFSKLTPEEKLLADFLVTMFRTKYENLVKNFKDFKGRQNYVTHMARSFMETLRETGSLTEAYNAFVQDNKEHENALEILASQTGEILAFDKFLPYMLKRSGTLVPSKNVSRIALTYFTATTRKELLDEFIPEALLTLHGYKMITGQTQKGLDLKPMLERFTKEYLNDAKGRKIDFITRQGSFYDNFWLGFTTWISAKYIGGNPVLATMNLFGDLLALSAGTSNAQKVASVVRIFQKNNAGEVIRGIVGHSPLVEIFSTQEGAVQKILPFWFSLMSMTSYVANQLTVRGMLTQDEFRTGVVKDERLLEIAQQINKFKLTDTYGRSLVGRTTAGKASLQFKTWAIPFLITTMEHMSELVGAIKTKSFTPENKQQAVELARIVIIGGIAYATVQALKGAFGGDDDKDSYLWRQISNNLNTIYGVLSMPFNKDNLVPIVIGEIGKVQDLLLQLWTMEEYKRPTATNYTGDLKAVKTFKDIVTPVGATRIFNLNKDTRPPKMKLISEALQTGEFNAEEIAQKTSQDWETKTPEAREKVVQGIVQAHTALVKYPNSEVVAIALGENDNKEKVAELVNYAKKVGVDQAYSDVKAILKDKELYMNQKKHTGALISAQLFRDFQVEIKKLKANQ